ncbi:hypothetical protein EDEG_02422 [Edhazardia aedis USNM 41457]|uniref:Uncharacterized protein n=1 Tax=Edhazardia aedis (strain USNM 41457) TaxID=1003232 RepID=J9DPD9_EDHAE|nr:hypothetical protein EDEG_02422 [Edhazardia aedis USNM 41457]|eukprot:EJW03207.1 hypothetical protein EDEG_02422 [Edhazardia aedis USNM 41457]
MSLKNIIPAMNDEFCKLRDEYFDMKLHKRCLNKLNIAGFVWYEQERKQKRDPIMLLQALEHGKPIKILFEFIENIGELSPIQSRIIYLKEKIFTMSQKIIFEEYLEMYKKKYLEQISMIIMKNINEALKTILPKCIILVKRKQKTHGFLMLCMH